MGQERPVANEVARRSEANNGFAARSTVAGKLKVAVLHAVDSAHVLALGKELFTFFDVSVALKVAQRLDLLAVEQSKRRFLPGWAGGAEGIHGDRVLGFYQGKSSLIKVRKM